MLLTLNIAPGVQFRATASSIGLSDKDAAAMQARPEADRGTDFVWINVRQASDRLFHTEPQGSC